MLPIVPVSQLLDNARQGGYAVGYFESCNIASLQQWVDRVHQRKPLKQIILDMDFSVWPTIWATSSVDWRCPGRLVIGH